jgi:hypothetical protein
MAPRLRRAIRVEAVTVTITGVTIRKGIDGNFAMEAAGDLYDAGLREKVCCGLHP